LAGRKVLLVDVDSQSAATQHLGFNFAHTRHVATVYDSLVGDRPLEKAVLPTPIENLFLVPSNIDLSAAQIELFYIENRENVLKKVLSPVRGDYDFVVVDCAPSLSTLLVAALVSADLAIIPIQPEFFSLSGLSSLLEVFDMVQKKMHKQVEYRILFTMFDKRLRLSREVEENLRKRFPDKILKVKIPRNVRITEAPGFGLPIARYDAECKGAKAYQKLAEEILEMIG